MGERNLERAVLQDGVIVERRQARRAVHFIELREAADRARMAHRQVIALHEVLGEDFPVRVPEMGLAEGLGVRLHGEVVDETLNLGEMLGDGRQLRIERDHDPAEPLLAPYRRQPIVLGAEVAIELHGRRRPQRAVEIVRPGMIRTDDRALVAGAFEQRRHAMEAHVRHGAQLAVAVANDEDRLARQLVCEVIAGLLECIGAADGHPLLGEYILDLAVQKFLACVDARRHGPRPLEGLADIGDQLSHGR